VDLEEIVQGELKMFFGQSERIAGHLQAADRNLTEKSDLLATHQQEIQKVRDEMQQIKQLYLQKQISGDGFRDFYTPIEERMNQLNAKLPKLEAEVNWLKAHKLSANDVLYEANTLHDRWPKMPMPDKRKIVEALIEKLVIGNGTIDITYSCLPTSIEQCKNQQGLGHR
jgi:site-specific DNA recombinase